MSEENAELDLAKRLSEVPEGLQELMTAGLASFLEPLSIAQPLSEACTGGGARPGDWLSGFGDDQIVVNDERDDEGGIVHVVLGPIRPHALLLVKKEVKSESFVQDSKEFQDIQKEAMSRSKDQERRAMFGPDFLAYRITSKKFCVYFCSKTARREAPALLEVLTRPVKLGVKKVEGKAGTWWVPRLVGVLQGDPPTIDGKLLEATLKVFAAPTIVDPNAPKAVDPNATGLAR